MTKSKFYIDEIYVNSYHTNDFTILITDKEHIWEPANYLLYNENFALDNKRLVKCVLCDLLVMQELMDKYVPSLYKHFSMKYDENKDSIVCSERLIKRLVS